MPYKDKNKQRKYQREYQRNRRNGSAAGPASADLPASFRLETARDLVALLEEQIEAVRNDPTARALDKARCIAALINVALKVLEQRDLVDRVAALEAILREPERAVPQAA